MGTRHPSPRRRWLVITGICVLTALVAAAALRSPSPVGHWNSSQGRDEFAEVYAEAFAALPEPERTLDVRTDFGIVRAYRFAGDGDASAPLVLLPGRASASPVWADNLPSLLDIGDVYTIDLLGEPGMSVQDRPIENDADQARWLHQALDGLPEDGFHVVGLSIGGWTAANLATRQPDLIETLTLIDPVHVFSDIPLGTVVRALPAALPWLPRSWRDGFNSWTAGGVPVEDVPVADMIEAGMRHYTLRLPQPTRISEEELGRLGMPVLAVIAGDSVMHDAEEAVATAERTLAPGEGGGTVRLYPDASHAVSGEHPEEIAADVAAFVGRG
ncbi:alpha/beta fold hydrolase [Nocardiopsis lucentensis]|uniref:alpha/beta fold hydrolase n=1 Tax=Nocardiopsis lucentensis TaxID=53441 RepID=UPI0003462456|nr:alpha/beta hydrolase [Nocardiopsis lucentensis]